MIEWSETHLMLRDAVRKFWQRVTRAVAFPVAAKPVMLMPIMSGIGSMAVEGLMQ